MDKASYTIIKQSPIRKLVRDIGRRGHRKHVVHGLVEVDVTAARELIRAHEAATGETISFTGFIIACLARALDDHKRLQAYQTWRRRLVVFEDVDVSTMVEAVIDSHKQFLPHIIRAANRKSVRQIHDEIRAAQAKPRVNQRVSLFHVLTRLPAFVRDWLYHYLEINPLLEKDLAGTCAVSALGMFGQGSSGWGIVISNHPLSATIGGIAAKPAIIAGEIAVRDILCMTFSFDHDIIDGAPAARFVEQVKELIEAAWGLDNLAT